MDSLKIQKWAALGLLLVAFAGLAYNAQAQSPTMDEQNHIARGYVFLRSGDPRLSVEHPPFINSLEALPLLMLSDVYLPTDDWSWEAGEWYRFADLFMWQVNHEPDRMVYLARLPVIGLTMLLTCLAARWSGQVWGRSGALLSLALTALDPNLLAHGGLATTDMGQTVAVFVAAYAVWRTLRRLPPRQVLARQPWSRAAWRNLALTGLALGCMLASKISALAFLGVFGGLLVVDGMWYALRQGRLTGMRESVWPPARLVLERLAITAGLVLVALLVLWGLYAFELSPAVDNGPRLPMGTYWKGVLSIFEQTQGGRPSYLLGQTSTHGWWSYFPIAFAVKTPLPSLALLGLALLTSLAPGRGPRPWQAHVFLLSPVLAYWALVTRSALNIGYRHLLPTLPLMYVWIGQLGAFKFGRAARAGQALGLALLAWLALETASIAPHFLSYFNQMGGGPTQGWKIIADSNIDWGQDLKALRDYVHRHDLGKIKLSWFGSSYPEAYGLDYEPLPGLPHHFDLWTDPPFDPQQPEPGVYAISVSNLVEIPYEDKRVFAYFRARPPDARVGYSVYIYRIAKR